MHITILKPEELVLPPEFTCPKAYIKWLWANDQKKWLELASKDVFDSKPSSYDSSTKKEL